MASIIANTIVKNSAMQEFVDGRLGIVLVDFGEPSIELVPIKDISDDIYNNFGANEQECDSDELQRFYVENRVVTMGMLEEYSDGYETYDPEEVFPHISCNGSYWEVCGDYGVTLAFAYDSEALNECVPVVVGIAMLGF